ncbi:MAG: secretin N-terminal domain-containing protein [bacterium]|nr:secretin N-terminal domain-containing protein [bacterium]
MLKRNNIFFVLKLTILLVFFSTSILMGQAMCSEKAYLVEEESPVGNVPSSFQRLKMIRVPHEDKSKISSPSSPSQGRLRLEVDVADDAGIDTISELITLEHIKASEIEPFIKARLSRYGTVQVNDALNMLIITDKEHKVRDLTKLVRGLDVGGLKDFLRLETNVIPLKYVLASSLTQIVKERLSSDGTVQADNNLNVLIITDVKSKIDHAKKIIAILDIPTTQILIEAKIIETSSEIRNELGVDWWALTDLLPQGSLNYYKTKRKTEQDHNYYYNSQDSQFSGNAHMDLTKLGDFVNLLIKQDKAKLLSNPKIMTLNNRVGRIIAMETVEYQSSSWRYNREQLGLILQITPHIGASNYINIDISANMRNLSGWNSNGSPIVSEQRVDSSVLVKDGETFTIGGLRKKNVIKITKRVPILGYILPFIFSKKEDSVKENDLLIFITPHIVKIDTQIEPADLKKLEEIEKEGKK